MDAQAQPASPSELSLLMPTGDGSSTGKCYFTWMQLKELEQQSLILRYMEAGIPIPTSLILPIWRSFPSYITHKFYPNLVSHLDQKSGMMEAEPGRCRRSDGKKWRCTRSVVEGHKYCHSHLMRRGRPLCSKNHVHRRSLPLPI